MNSHAPNHARVLSLRPVAAVAATEPEPEPAVTRPPGPVPATAPAPPAAKEPLWRHIVGDVLRRERLAQERTLKDVAETARISMPYLSELERGRKEGSSEVLAAVAHALGLGLADLLALGHRELARPGRARTRRPRTASASASARRPVTAVPVPVPTPVTSVTSVTTLSSAAGSAAGRAATGGGGGTGGTVASVTELRHRHTRARAAGRQRRAAGLAA